MKDKIFSAGRAAAVFGLLLGGYILLGRNTPSASEGETAERQPQGLVTGFFRAGKRAARARGGADDLRLSGGWRHRDGINFRGERPDLPQEALLQFRRFWSAFPPAVPGTAKKSQELIAEYQQTQDPEDFEKLLRLTGVRSFISRQSHYVIQSLKPAYPNADLFLQDALQESTALLFERLKSTKNAEYNLSFPTASAAGFLNFQNELERKVKAMLSYPRHMSIPKTNKGSMEFSPFSTEEQELARAGGFSVFRDGVSLPEESEDPPFLLYWKRQRNISPQQSFDPFEAVYQDQIFRRETVRIARILQEEAPSVIRRRKALNEDTRKAGDAAARYMISRRIFANQEERETLQSIAKKFNLSFETIRKIEHKLIIRAQEIVRERRLDLKPSLRPLN